MSRHSGQTFSMSDPHFGKLQLAVLKQQNKRLIHEIVLFQITHYLHQDELNILLNVAKQLKYHYFAVVPQPLLSLPDKASQSSRISFFYI